MFVDVTISGNRKYCEDRNLVNRFLDDDNCCQEPECPHCHGTGKVFVDEYPCELFVWHEDLERLWRYAGLGVLPCEPFCEPHNVAERVNRAHTRRLSELGDKAYADKLAIQLTKLLEISMQAIERREVIVFRDADC